MISTYQSTKNTCLKLGVCKKTLHNWTNEGKIDFIRTEGGWRKYNVDKYLKQNTLDKKIKVCYCRVSSYDQKEDLSKQIMYLTNKYPSYEIIKDIGSGINFKRKGLLKLISYAIENKLGEVVVTYEDRLCRIGYDLIEYIFKTYSNATVIIENQEFKPHTQEITEDLIEIITVYSSKIYGSRSYKIG
jgi:predicted site-specific integrase-resolvase